MKYWLILLGVLGLSSCTRVHYGNFTDGPSHHFNAMAKDTVTQLVSIFPPARTQFCFSQRVKDGYGIELIRLLRERGYGLIESRCMGQGVRFAYVVDTSIKKAFYRVTVWVESQSLSRVYSLNQSQLMPVSAWSYKE
ncbi:MAG: conjugal transfer protein TrbH [Legionella sp.]|uniref:conjugal transfer protein TrbH n=1 Tax=Legionella sp. TaxID=459 RepID=UPI0039E6E8BB